MEPFTNQARNDGLVLHHWGRKKIAKAAPKRTESTASEEPGLTEGEDAQDSATDKEYQFSKYDVQVEVPTYTQELYNAQLQDPDWTEEETDHLVDLVRDYGQKWPVVFDRWDYQPTKMEDGGGPEDSHAKSRTMEHLKHRYYNVAAKVLAHNTPISSMNAAEYTLYSTLQAFNPVQETARKKLAEGHLYRSQVEVDEETVLLAELQRIMINQAQLEQERREIRDRLEFPINSTNTSGAQYSTSAALGTLFQQLLQADRLKKDRKFKNPPADYPNATPTTAGAAPAANASSQSAHRDSIPSSVPGRKSGARDSLAGGAGSDSGRPLTAHAEQRYFITHHDRISSGVSFASDKLAKPRNAKSAIQTERIAAILTHLQIPDMIPLPTQKVVEEFERLMQKVNVLLEMRKVAEKEEGEIRVKNAEKNIKGERDGSGVAVKEERRASLVAGADGGSAESSDGGPQQTAGQKRSASVMSGGVGPTTSTKRPKN